MSGYTKLLSSITDSTIWQEPHAIRIVWITMLAMADQNGYVAAAVPGLASRAKVTMEECQDALKRFQEPDEWSRTKDFEGRRITPVDGGWILLNHAKHRAVRDAEERREQSRLAMARLRAERKGAVNDVSNVSHGEPALAQAEAEEEATKLLSASATPDAPPNDKIPYQFIVDQYNSNMTNLPKVRELTPKRKTAIRTAWQASKNWRSKEFWIAYFAECNDDKFNNGTGPYKPPHENWRPDFDYLIKVNTVTKIFERVMDRMEKEA